MSPGPEQRRYTRSTVCARAELRLSCGMLMEALSRDVSLNGMFVNSDRMLPVGHTCHVTLMFEGGVGKFRVATNGRVVRVDEDGIAIEFEEVEMEGGEHLRKLLLCNADEPERMREEMEASVRA